MYKEYLLTCKQNLHIGVTCELKVKTYF